MYYLIFLYKFPIHSDYFTSTCDSGTQSRDFGWLAERGQGHSSFARLFADGSKIDQNQCVCNVYWGVSYLGHCAVRFNISCGTLVRMAGSVLGLCQMFSCVSRLTITSRVDSFLQDLESLDSTWEVKANVICRTWLVHVPLVQHFTAVLDVLGWHLAVIEPLG